MFALRQLYPPVNLLHLIYSFFVAKKYYCWWR